MPIRILPAHVANQIAAGEVVERPASAVKELVENSLDAGASEIRIEIREGGRRLLRVQDDGSGIPCDEATLAFQRHATSKITSADDLQRITTLGFRGEALASIASVAQVSLLSRPAEQEIGSVVRVNAGVGLTREPYGGPAGTTITVEHLFANVPARLKFLKRAATEAAHIQEIVARYALAYPDRRFSLTSDGRLIFQSSGTGRLQDVLAQVYGLDTAAQMLAIDPVALDDPAEPAASASAGDGIRRRVRVTGYVGAPSLNRSNRSYISLFVNRRWFQDSSLAYSIIQAFHTLLPVGRYPVAVVFIEMPPEDVDVNVHPTKAEVRFRDAGAVFGAVQRAVRRTLVDRAPIVSIGGSHAEAPQPGSGPTWDAISSWSMRREALLEAGRAHRQMDLPTRHSPEEEADVIAGRSSPGTLPPAGSPEMPAKIPILRVVGQLGATYILAEGPDGLYLIDQHAAHERILYEQYLAQHATGQVTRQPLLEPLLLELSAEQAAVVAEQLDAFAEMGIDIEGFGGSSYLVRSLPALLSQDDPQAALTEIIDGLAGHTDLVENTREARLVTTICKRAAIKGGHPLTPVEMRELVEQLERCRSPRTCPHGRPTMVFVSAAELARQFGRM